MCLNHVLHLEIALWVCGNKQVKYAVIVEIEELGCVGMGLRANAGLNADIFKSPITEIPEQEWALIETRCKQILSAVSVVVSPTKRNPSSSLRQTGLLADFAKFPVSFVVVKADAVAALRVDDAGGDGEIDAPIVIVIRPRSAEGIYGSAQACACSDIGEAFATFIVKKEKAATSAPAVAGQKDVLEAVVVVINKLRSVAAEANR